MNDRDNQFRKRLAFRIDHLRESRRISATELADRMFVTKASLESLLRGKSINADHLRRLSEVLDISLPDLIDSNISLEYHSVFISYGGPDETIARQFYNFLKSKGVGCFFFPETAIPGKRLHRTMSDGINNYDRILLLCSTHSLKRKGVLNEIEQVLIREAAEGGSELLIPITLDDFVFTGWRPSKPDIARQLKARVVADFRKAKRSQRGFKAEMRKIMKTLRRHN
jgi:transcriptional regulator with XRE-family HTH domain